MKLLIEINIDISAIEAGLAATGQPSITETARTTIVTLLQQASMTYPNTTQQTVLTGIKQQQDAMRADVDQGVSVTLVEDEPAA